MVDVADLPWCHGKEPGSIMAEVELDEYAHVLTVDHERDMDLSDDDARKLADYIIRLHNKRLGVAHG